MRLAKIIAFVLVVLPIASQHLVAQTSTISITDRAMVASKIYQQVTTLFPDLSHEQFERDYRDFLDHVLSADDDRRHFDLAAMALVASLHDGHSWFYDSWIERNYGQSVGLQAYRLGNTWVVMRSALPSVHVGDVVEAIDNLPTQQYFERSKIYISASSDRDAEANFFNTPVVFPERFTMTLDGNRHIVVDRKQDRKAEPSNETTGRWLVLEKIGYIKLPSFQDMEVAGALDLLRRLKNAKVLILDLRGNFGGGDPSPIVRSVMDRPYQTWTELSSMKGGALSRGYGMAHAEGPQVTAATAVTNSPRPIFTGKLLLLTDRGCTSACEDFSMRFKLTHRAQLIGETTAGTFSFTNRTQFENGMVLNIASVRNIFPDGSRFEGVGIAPDIEVQPSIQDWKAGKDVVLERALNITSEN